MGVREEAEVQRLVLVSVKRLGKTILQTYRVLTVRRHTIFVQQLVCQAIITSSRSCQQGSECGLVKLCLHLG